MKQLSMHTPLGDITIFEDADAIVALDWGWSSTQQPSALLLNAKQQLDEYFDGDRSSFALPLAPRGTAFQARVWGVMATIVAGKTMTYGDIAAKIHSNPRPVGSACGKNPIPILIPCHRVLASGGLGGYSGEGGLETKQALLALEGALAVSPFYD